MKAFSVIMNAIYAIAIVAVLLFVVGGFIPEDLNGEPLGIDIGTESEYPISDPVELLEMNIKDAVHSYGNAATVHIDDGVSIATVYPNDDASVTDAADAIHDYYILHPDSDKKAVLKGGDQKVLTQEMIMRESNEIAIRIYTEITITNNLRYDLLDIDVSVDQLNDKGVAIYKIISSESTTIATGQAASLPINVEINTLNSALIMLIGASDTIDINIGFDISGKYLYGLAGASVHAAAKFSTESPIDPPVIDDHKITVTSDEKLDIVPMDGFSASIGDIDITFINDDLTGFSLVIDSGSAMTILEVLKAQYAAENYTIEIDTGDPSNPEIIELEPEEYAQLIDIVEQIMEGLSE